MLLRFATNQIQQNTQKFIDVVSFCEISTVGLEKNIDQIQEVASTLAQYGLDTIDLVSVRTYYEGSSNNDSNIQSVGNLKQKLAKDRRNYEIVIVEPFSAEIAAFSARDNRVDGIRITSNSQLSLFNRRYSKRLIEYDKFVEFDLSSIFKDIKAKYIRPQMRIIESFKGSKVPFVLTYQVNSVEEIRSYRGIEAMGKLYGLLNTRSSRTYFQDLLVKNRKKISGDIIYPGVEKIGREN